VPESARPTQFGRIYPPDEAWLAKHSPEPVLDADLPIIDTHHHLWERPDHRYLLHEFLADVNSGHNVVATVFVECNAMYRAQGPVEMRPVGQTEFVAGMAAMSDSGLYGKTRVAAGIVGFADLTLGDRVEPVLEAAYDYRARAAPPSSADLAALWGPYIEPCIELFGADSCTFESNFPVEKMGIGWVPLWNAFKRIAAGASATEKLTLFSGTARRAYRLD